MVEENNVVCKCKSGNGVIPLQLIKGIVDYLVVLINLMLAYVLSSMNQSWVLNNDLKHSTRLFIGHIKVLQWPAQSTKSESH